MTEKEARVIRSVFANKIPYPALENPWTEKLAIELDNALKKQIPKKPICKEKPYSEYVGFNYEWHCPTCGAYVGYSTEGMNEPEQMKYCNECGQHIAREWGCEEC